jgi:hypothetical protein
VAFYFQSIRLTIIHLLPSSFLTGGFLVRMLSGFGFLPGAGLLPRDIEDTLDWLSLRVGTVAPARNDGFLCVIWSALTFRRPFVTASPLFSSLNTAPSPPASCTGAAFGSSNFIGGGGGPGGGGGGGAPAPAAFGCGAGGLGSPCVTALIASSTEIPLGFQGRPWG